MNFSFDQYQRFEICQKILGILNENQSLKKSFILDLGGSDGSVFESAEIQSVMVIADRHIIPSSAERLYIKADAMLLPFINKAFLITVSLDTFEHIPQSDRCRFVKEIQRITNKHIVTSFPQLNIENEHIEKILSGIINMINKKEDIYLSQHLTNRLPSSDELTECLEEEIKTVVSFGMGNTYIWFLLAVIKRLFSSYGQDCFYADLTREMDYFYNQHIAGHDNIPPYYRLFAVISYEDLGVELKERILALQAGGKEFLLDREILPFFALNYGITALKSESGHISSLHRLMKGYEDHFGHFHTIIAEKDRVISECLDFLQKKEQIISYLKEENDKKESAIEVFRREYESVHSELKKAMNPYSWLIYNIKRITKFVTNILKGNKR